jgi:hypothetical protein
VANRRRVCDPTEAIAEPVRPRARSAPARSATARFLEPDLSGVSRIQFDRRVGDEASGDERVEQFSNDVRIQGESLTSCAAIVSGRLRLAEG